MPTKIKVQKDYLLTEVSIENDADLSELDAIMKATKATGKLVILYNQGGRLGINLEQKTKATETDSVKMRNIMGIDTTVV